MLRVSKSPETILTRVKTVANNACGQIVCSPNGSFSYTNGGSLAEFNSIEFYGSCFLCRAKSNKVYVITASHIVDSLDAYLDNFNIIFNQFGWTNSGSASSSIKEQKKLFILTNSTNSDLTKSFKFEFKLLDEQFNVLYSSDTDTININLEDTTDLSDIGDNIFDTLGLNYDSDDQTSFTFSDGVLTAGTSGYCLASIDLTQFQEPPSIISYSYTNNDNGISTDSQFALLTNGTKNHNRWTNFWYESAFPIFDSNSLNQGFIYGLFPNINSKQLLVPLKVIGGDHRSDIAILRPNFDMLESVGYNISENDWDSQDAISLERINNITDGQLIGKLGNPYFVMNNGISGGNISKKKYNETNYAPFNSMIVTVTGTSGDSGTPFLTENGTACGMLTFGTDVGGLLGGPNCDMLTNIFNYVTASFENSNEPQIKKPKNFLGITYFNVSVESVGWQFTSTFNSNGSEFTGIIVDYIDPKSPLYEKVDYSDILLRATYIKIGESEQTTLKFGTREAETGVTNIEYDRIVDGKVDFLVANSNLTQTRIESVIVSRKNYPNHMDYYFGVVHKKTSKIINKKVKNNEINHLIIKNENSKFFVSKYLIVNKKNTNSFVQNDYLNSFYKANPMLKANIANVLERLGEMTARLKGL